jgi:hypothetical protein
MSEEAAFAYQMQLAMAMSAREAQLAGSSTGADFAAAPSAARNTPTAATSAPADSAAAELIRSRRDGQTVANRYYITMCMDYAHGPYNGFYDLWGDFPEAETGNSRLPPLEQLAQIGYDAASPGCRREVLLVDHCSDGNLQKLRAQALAALATLPVSQYRAKVRALTALVLQLSFVHLVACGHSQAQREAWQLSRGEKVFTGYQQHLALPQRLGSQGKAECIFRRKPPHQPQHPRAHRACSRLCVVPMRLGG